MSKKLFIKGTLLLTFAGLASRLIGFFYRIFLSHTIGAEGLGIFQLVMPLQILALAFCASGIQTAISRLTASRKALGCPGRAGDYFISGTLFSVLFSLVLSFLFYYRADFWAVKILKEPRTASLIRMMAPAVPLSTLHTCINSYYFARKRRVPEADLPGGTACRDPASGTGFPCRRLLCDLSCLYLRKTYRHTSYGSRRKSHRGNCCLHCFSLFYQYAF